MNTGQELVAWALKFYLFKFITTLVLVTFWVVTFIMMLLDITVNEGKPSMIYSSINKGNEYILVFYLTYSGFFLFLFMPMFAYLYEYI